MYALEHVGLKEAVTQTYNAIHDYQGAPRELTAAVLLSLIFSVVLIINNVLLSWAIGMTVDVQYFFVFVAVTAFFLFIPISIKGLGVREAAYVFFFTQVGATSAEAVALSVLVHVLELIEAAIGGVLYARE